MTKQEALAVLLMGVLEIADSPAFAGSLNSDPRLRRLVNVDLADEEGVVAAVYEVWFAAEMAEGPGAEWFNGSLRGQRILKALRIVGHAAAASGVAAR